MNTLKHGLLILATISAVLGLNYASYRTGYAQGKRPAPVTVCNSDGILLNEMQLHVQSNKFKAGPPDI